MKVCSLIIVAFLLLTSCSLQKRHYRQGFYTDFKSKTQRVVKNNNVYASSSGEMQLVQPSAPTPGTTGCDTLFLNTRQTIIAKVTEITPSEIKFVSCLDSAKPVISVKRGSVYFIGYSNGTYEEISPATKTIPSRGECPVIYLNEGKAIKAKLLSAKHGRLKFRPCGSTRQPAYTTNISDIAMIVYPTGYTQAVTLAGNKTKPLEKMDREIIRTSPYAIVSAIGSLISAICVVTAILGALGAYVGIIGFIIWLLVIGFGLAGRDQVKYGGGRYKGKGLAICSMLLPLLTLQVIFYLFLAKVI